MPSNYFTRTGANNQFVQSINGRSRIKFDTNYGGAPLIWEYKPRSTYYRVISTINGAPFPGEGFQVTIEEGQDLTQAGANGITQLQIARTNVDTGLTLYYKNYYVRESLDGFPTGNVSLDQYIITGFFPDFWASLQGGAVDDSIPPNSNGHKQEDNNNPPPGAGWVTGYTSPNSTSTFPYSLNSWGTPVYFSPYIDSGGTHVSSGILMEGNERKPLSLTWKQRLRSIPYGRVAFRIKVSLSNGSDDSWGGILFRKSVPSSGSGTMDDVYSARGYMLLVNRAGLISLIYTNASGVQSTVWTYGPTTATVNAVRNSYGIQLELRTFNGLSNRFEIWADGVPLTVDGSGNPQALTLSPSQLFDSQDAQHLGLIAYTTNSQPRISGEPNFVRFADREVFNVGTETRIVAAPQADGSLITTVTIAAAANVTEKRRLYRANQVAFLEHSAGYGYVSALTETPVGTTYQGPTTSSDLTGHIVGASSPVNDLIYVGEASGLLGLCCVPTSVSITGGVSVPYLQHFLARPSGVGLPILHINGLPDNDDVNGPWEMTSITIQARWYPYNP